MKLLKTYSSLGLVLSVLCHFSSAEDAPDSRPNILFAIADDWGWHAGIYGDPVVKTPTFDRIAREGVLFNHAFISSPSCTPSRSAILTGQWHWRLEEGGNLWGTFPKKHPVYTDILKENGYFVGYTRKGWGPGRLQPGGRTKNPAGDRFKNFTEFLAKRPKGNPFCFWFGSNDPHRGYRRGSGKAAGMKLENIKLEACFLDSPEVRGDVADYYVEVQRFDNQVGGLLKELDAIGELDKTVVVMTSDHGMPFPRCKSNVYDTGARVPLAIRWPQKVKAGRVVDDFVSLTDMAPTFLEAAGLKTPEVMTGRSIMNLLIAKDSGRIEPSRDHVFIGKERHTVCQEAPETGGTPMRAVRTYDFLYIRNFAPDRWPSGTPNYEKARIKGSWLADCDNGPTKTYMVEHQDDDAHHRKLYNAAFAKRPAEELYDVKKDPGQLNNIVADAAFFTIKESLAALLMAELKKTRDPRVIGGGEKFDKYPYYGGTPKFPGFGRKKK